MLISVYRKEYIHIIYWNWFLCHFPKNSLFRQCECILPFNVDNACLTRYINVSSRSPLSLSPLTVCGSAYNEQSVCIHGIVIGNILANCQSIEEKLKQALHYTNHSVDLYRLVPLITTGPDDTVRVINLPPIQKSYTTTMAVNIANNWIWYLI